MKINGKEVTFDMDSRKDFNRFAKALAEFSKKQERGGNIGDSDLELFLSSCLAKEEIEPILADGKISTLVNAVKDFYKACVEQIEGVSDVYLDVSNTLKETRVMANELSAKMRSGDDE